MADGSIKVATEYIKQLKERVRQAEEALENTVQVSESSLSFFSQRFHLALTLYVFSHVRIRSQLRRHNVVSPLLYHVSMV